MEKEKEIIMYKYLERLRVKLIQKYEELGLRASGKYQEQLEPEVSGSKMIMWGAKHAWFMERGRGKGFVHRKIIENWIEVKRGLPSVFYEKKKQIAFLIARKITAEGITVPNQFNKGKVIESVVNDFLGNDIYEMLEELGEIYRAQIVSEVVEIFKKVA